MGTVPLTLAPLVGVLELLRSGALTVSDHVRAICDRLDETESAIRAYVPEPDRRERLLAEAATLEQRWPAPSSRPRLYGAALGVKDVVAVDGLPTRGGSMVPPEALTMPQAHAVTALRDAGALVVGKTVTTEFASADPGSTTNPHDTRHTPGGSSSGSAAAVAVGTAQLAIGTQTVGSVIRPAAFCGVVGYKPTYDRIPTSGILYYSRSVDHIGLFAQDVAGLELAARVTIPDWAGVEEVRKPVLGVPQGPYLDQADQVGRAGFEATISHLEASGIRVLRVPALEDIEQINGCHLRLTRAEFAQEHRERFAKFGGLYRPRNAMLIDGARELPDGVIEDGRASRAALRERLHAAMETHGIDLWVSPAATGPAPLRLDATGSPIMNLPWTHAGSPTVTLPAGRAEGLPLGLQLSGRFGTDERVLAQAAQLELLLVLDR